MTGGLRKVTDDMKTKNQADRSGAVPAVEKPAVAAAAAAPAARAAGGGKAPRGPPKLELEGGRKWLIENQAGMRFSVVSRSSHAEVFFNGTRTQSCLYVC